MVELMVADLPDSLLLLVSRIRSVERGVLLDELDERLRVADRPLSLVLPLVDLSIAEPERVEDLFILPE